MNEFQSLIKDICDKNNIKMDILSKGWIIALEKDNVHRFIVGCKFANNNHSLGLALDDKFATYELLKYINIPIVEHQIIYSEKNRHVHAKDCQGYDYVYNFFQNNNGNIVIKINDGARGKNCYHITNKKDIKRILTKLFQKHYSLSMQPYLEIKNEYRIIMLNNKILLMYQKIKPIVYGDGKQNIRQLLYNFNPHFFKEKLKGKKYDRILNKDEIFVYNWQFNLSSGAVMCENIPLELKSKLQDLAKSVAQKLDLGFVSVDIIDTARGLMILEINSGVAMGHYRKIAQLGYEKSKDIYEQAVLKMFD